MDIRLNFADWVIKEYFMEHHPYSVQAKFLVENYNGLPKTNNYKDWRKYIKKIKNYGFDSLDLEHMYGDWSKKYEC